MTKIVIVRSFGGKPARLVEIERDSRLVYVASERSLDRIASGDSSPVGVPREDVYRYTAESFEAVQTLWSGGANSAWEQANLEHDH